MKHLIRFNWAIKKLLRSNANTTMLRVTVVILFLFVGVSAAAYSPSVTSVYGVVGISLTGNYMDAQGLRGAISVATGNSVMTISPNGSVGIGTTAPSTKLEVSGTVSASAVQVNGVVTANSFVGIGSGLTNLPTVSTANLALTSNIAISMNAQGLMGAISVATGNAVMSITTAGNVGIGTTSPAEKLQVLTAASGQALKLRANSSADNAFTGLVFKVDTLDDVAGSFSDRTKAGIFFQRDAGVSRGIGKFIFALNNADGTGASVTDENATTDAKMVILNNGYVGIGTPTPSTKLDVAGTVSANAYIGDGANLSNVSKYKFAIAQFDSGTNTKTISDGFCDANSWVQIEVQGIAQGTWVVVSSAGSFTITSTAIETSSVEFIYRIMKQ